jgi:hypothetical protein
MESSSNTEITSGLIRELILAVLKLTADSQPRGMLIPMPMKKIENENDENEEDLEGRVNGRRFLFGRRYGFGGIGMGYYPTYYPTYYPSYYPGIYGGYGW